MRALISVSNKENIVWFAKELENLGVEIISTGGTYKVLSENGVKVKEVSEYTNYQEILDGRVKTLNPTIHAGILAKRNSESHKLQMQELNLGYIDIVVCNLYPFKKTILKSEVSLEEAIENIDIGGPTMLRSAAKNYCDVCSIVNPNDYQLVIDELKENGQVSLDTKFYLMQKVFEHTSNYDQLIANYIRTTRNDTAFPQELTLGYELVMDLRYGENPHQQAAFYKEVTSVNTLSDAVQLHGKELSYNNINDTSLALELLKEFDEPTVVASKHGNPCGVGSGSDITIAWKKAYEADVVSIFGGIVVFNREVNKDIAIEINNIFIEVILAPSYSQDALEILTLKKNIRILELKDFNKNIKYDFKRVDGGLIIQTYNNSLLEEMNCVTFKKPTENEIEDLIFAFKIVKHVKSNGICIAKNKQSLGIGPGQVNRIWATNQAIEHCENKTNGAVLASDAFFPFDDCVISASKANVSAIIQPGGSIRDNDSINKCNELNIAMVFTKTRHFKH